MKLIKKAIACLLTATALFSLPACATIKDIYVELSTYQKEQKTQDTGEEYGQANSDMQEETYSATQEDTPKEFDTFCFTLDGITLTPGDVYDTSLFADISDPIQTPDCRTGNTATVYYYKGFSVQTVTPADLESGTTGSPRISDIIFDSAEAATPEGVRLGDTRETVLKIYGSGYEEQFGGFVYTAGDTKLTVVFDTETDTVIYLVISAGDELLAELSEAPEVEAAPIVYDETLRDYPGITYEGLDSIYFTDYEDFEAFTDFDADVRAYDEYGNELPITYEVHMQAMTETYHCGFGVIVYSATDSEGHTAREWRNIFVEEYTEEDQQVIETLAAATTDDIYDMKTYIYENIIYAYDYRLYSPIANGWRLRSGNCLVYTRMLQTLLEYKGYHAIAVWSLNDHHFWVMVKTEDGWRHIDATRGDYEHFPYGEGLETDEERMVHHSNRPWDTDLWPECRSLTAEVTGE